MNPAVRRNAWIAWAAVCLIWGTTYLAIKIALETIPPFLMGGIRYLIGGSILAVWVLARGQALPPPREWGRLALLGFLMIALGNGGVVWAEQYLASGLTAVVIATSPFWMVAIDTWLPGADRLSARQWGGLFIGFLGIVMLVWPDISLGGVTGRGVVLGVLSVQVACIGWAIASAYTRRHSMSRNVLGVAAVQMFFGGLFMTLAGTAMGEWPHLTFSSRTLASLVYLTLAGSVIAFAAYSYALRHLPIATVSLYTYVNPVIAVALGTLLLGEPFRLSMIAAALVIVVGMLVVRPVRRPSRA
ncbi:MAG: EamA family transporter [Acidobacteria bacterium]|nr:EamA family transporter [Acidobacteriota bacterium]